MITESAVMAIAVAAVGGAAVGVERQRSGHAVGRNARFGGVRTFTLLGGLAGIAGWLATLGHVGFALILAGGAVALVVVGYGAASRQDVDATTEVAALVVLGAGFAAGIGWLTLASGVIAVSTLLLVEKSQLHSLVARIDDEELRAAARFGVMAVVILPLLPQGPFTPLEIRPRALWLLVLFFTGLSFAGYLARRMFGPGRGYPLAGLLGGLISSTNVTFAFSRLSRRDPDLSRALAVGTIGACTMLFVRVILALCVLDLTVARALLPYFAAPFAAGVIALLLWWRAGAAVVHPAEMPSNPLQFGPALQMAAIFQGVLLAVEGARVFFGEGGLLVSGAVLGLTDVDALTIAMGRMPAAGTSAAVAAQALAIGVLANCVMKTGIAAALGTPAFRRLTGTLLITMAITIGIALAFL